MKTELTLETIALWPLVRKQRVIVGMSFILIIFGYYFIIKANLEQYQLLKIQEQVLRVTFESRQKQTSNRQAYRDQIQGIKKHFDLLLKLLPAKNEIAALLEALSQKGSFLGLRLESFTPQEEVIRDFYIELPIKMTVVGTYRQLAAFVSKAAQIKPMVSFHELSIERTGLLEEELVMNLTATTYRYR